MTTKKASKDVILNQPKKSMDLVGRQIGIARSGTQPSESQASKQTNTIQRSWLAGNHQMKRANKGNQ